MEVAAAAQIVVFCSIIAKASAGEVRSQAYRASDRNYIDEKEFTEVYEKALEIRKKRLLKSEI